MKVFISYGDAADQVNALRLQTLGAANGLTVFVPPAHTRRAAQALLDPASGRKLNDAEVVLGFVGNALSEACWHDTGLALGKNMIVMAYPHFVEQLRLSLGRTSLSLTPRIPIKPRRASSSTSSRSTLSRMRRRLCSRSALLFWGS